MNFIKETNEKGIHIPASALAAGGFADSNRLQLHVTNSLLAVVKGEMTAMDILNTIDSLSNVMKVLAERLHNVCGSCEECDDCSWNPEAQVPIQVPTDALRTAGIPESAKLRAEGDPVTGTVVIVASDAKNDLNDIPPELLDFLMVNDFCLGTLNEFLKTGEVIYGKD